LQDELDKDGKKDAQGKDLGSDFDTFLEEVERGWTSTLGATNTVDPYNKPYTKRPRIRKIGTDQVDDGKQ